MKKTFQIKKKDKSSHKEALKFVWNICLQWKSVGKSPSPSFSCQSYRLLWFSFYSDKRLLGNMKQSLKIRWDKKLPRAHELRLWYFYIFLFCLSKNLFIGTTICIQFVPVHSLRSQTALQVSMLGWLPSPSLCSICPWFPSTDASALSSYDQITYLCCYSVIFQIRHHLLTLFMKMGFKSSGSITRMVVAKGFNQHPTCQMQ